MDHKLIGTGDARAVQQRIDGKGGIARLNGFKPEGGKSGNSSGVSVKVSTASRARKSRTGRYHPPRGNSSRPGKNDIASRQFRRLNARNPAKPRSLCPSSCFGIPRPYHRLNSSGRRWISRAPEVVLIQRNMRTRRRNPSPYGRTGRQLTAFNVVPQRLLLIVTDGVVRLRRHGLPAFPAADAAHRPRFSPDHAPWLQNREVKTAALTVSNVRSTAYATGKTGEARPDSAAQGNAIAGNL